MKIFWPFKKKHVCSQSRSRMCYLVCSQGALLESRTEPMAASQFALFCLKKGILTKCTWLFLWRTLFNQRGLKTLTFFIHIIQTKKVQTFFFITKNHILPYNGKKHFSRFKSRGFHIKFSFKNLSIGQLEL